MILNFRFIFSFDCRNRPALCCVVTFFLLCKLSRRLSKSAKRNTDATI